MLCLFVIGFCFFILVIFNNIGKIFYFKENKLYLGVDNIVKIGLNFEIKNVFIYK